jgi:hypothetical protein
VKGIEELSIGSVRKESARLRAGLFSLVVGIFLVFCLSAPVFGGTHSVARQWNEVLLDAIRHDLARPTVHARNLFHSSVVMWDAWAMYDTTADQYAHFEKVTASDLQAERDETISFAAYRLLTFRFANSVGSDTSLPAFDALMDSLGYDKADVSAVGNSPAARGNRIALSMILYGLTDNANELGDYANLFYLPVNDPLVPPLPGNPDIVYPNRWQPLALEFFQDQGGTVFLGGYPDALSPEWGLVKSFALSDDDLTIYERDGHDYWVYHDPGPPPEINGVGNDYYKWGCEMVCVWSAQLDPTDGVLIDISPGSIGNSPLPDSDEYEAYYDFENGGDWGNGHKINPVTGAAYTPQLKPRGDYGRVLAEFWADGPDSETPPGHWFTILNYVSDHALFEKKIGGKGAILDDLEWDIKSYLAMGGAMHDVAVASWGVKGWYDYIRPVSAIRYMCDLGQCTDANELSFHEQGINLRPGFIEVVTTDTTMPLERHAHLLGHEGKIAVKAWRGPDAITNPTIDTAGVDWILAENWWPYQRPSFVTPPFPGYVSGHSTYSRAASELMTQMTGSEYFPGGIGEFFCPQNSFLVFEQGPSVDITLQWATYRDASDQTSLSRIWGGIHPPADDIPGRQMGEVIGPQSYHHALRYFDGTACPGDVDGDGFVGVSDLTNVLISLGTPNPNEDSNKDGIVDVNDISYVLFRVGESCLQ